VLLLSHQQLHLPVLLRAMTPCIQCLVNEADPLDGSICPSCLPPLRHFRSRRSSRLTVLIVSVRPA
jgi:hypothetical protein